LWLHESILATPWKQGLAQSRIVAPSPNLIQSMLVRSRCCCATNAPVYFASIHDVIPARIGLPRGQRTPR